MYFIRIRENALKYNINETNEKLYEYTHEYNIKYINILCTVYVYILFVEKGKKVYTHYTRKKMDAYILYCVGRGIGRKNTEKGLRNDKRKKEKKKKKRGPKIKYERSDLIYYYNIIYTRVYGKDE